MKNKIFGILILITSVLFFIYSSLVAIMAINILYTTDVNPREGIIIAILLIVAIITIFTDITIIGIKIYSKALKNKK